MGYLRNNRLGAIMPSTATPGSTSPERQKTIITGAGLIRPVTPIVPIATVTVPAYQRPAVIAADVVPGTTYQRTSLDTHRSDYLFTNLERAEAEKYGYTPAEWVDMLGSERSDIRQSQAMEASLLPGGDTVTYLAIGAVALWFLLGSRKGNRGK